MKTILICTTLTLAVSHLHAQSAPNREGIGDVPQTPGSPAAAKSDVPPGAPSSDKTSQKTPDERFLQKAGKGGKMEVKLAKMGVDKASRGDLKAFSSMLVTDHTAANLELAAIAKSMGIEIPGAGDKANDTAMPAPAQNDPSGRLPVGQHPEDADEATKMEKYLGLKEKTGMAFDAAYMEIMEECHAEDIALFEKAAGVVNSTELKAFITKTLPVLQKHATALAALERKAPSRPDAQTDSSTAPSAGSPDATPPNR